MEEVLARSNPIFGVPFQGLLALETAVHVLGIKLTAADRVRGPSHLVMLRRHRIFTFRRMLPIR